MTHTRTILLAAATILAWGPAATAQAPARTIPIVAKRFGYTPSEIRLKKGEPVTLVLTSEDVQHGLKAKDLGLDTAIKPGAETRVTITPDKAGTFTAFCNKFCGAGHTNMRLTVIVE